ncbi:MAG: metal-sulfur cluster assembly factor [Pirellulaceae bacterium]
MNPLTEDHVREALKQVIDPELFVNIVDLGLIYEVTIEPASADEPSDTEGTAEESSASEASASEAGDAEAPSTEAGDSPAPSTDEPLTTDGAWAVKIEMTMTSPMCPAGPQLVGQSKEFVSKLPGVKQVDVKVVMDPPWTPEKMTEDARDQLGIF